jgi:hypothetical protein
MASIAASWPACVDRVEGQGDVGRVALAVAGPAGVQGPAGGVAVVWVAVDAMGAVFVQVVMLQVKSIMVSLCFLP